VGLRIYRKCKLVTEIKNIESAGLLTDEGGYIAKHPHPLI